MTHTDTELARICHWLMNRDLIACATIKGELAIVPRDQKRPLHPHIRHARLTPGRDKNGALG